MWTLSKLVIGLAAWALQAAAPVATIEDRSHTSQVMGEVRNYRVFLPPSYSLSKKSYPVIYWFHGWSERYNQSAFAQPGRNYDDGPDFGGDTIAKYVSGHEVIVVKWDGWNPRKPSEAYLRPYNVSPVETQRQFALYFPELVDHIDKTLRTLHDRDHRGVTGYSMGGFMAYWVAGKYPDLVGSVSAFMPSTEFSAGPYGFDVEYRHEEMYGNYAGVKVRLITGTRDFIRFYHRPLDAIWRYTIPEYEKEEFESDHGVPGIAKTFDFHMQAFATPSPRPAVWNHADVYPNFTLWDWEVASNRRQPGITQLENVSKSGFRCSVREWLPSGAVVEGVKLSIASAKLYPPASAQPVTYVRLRDGNVKRTTLKADAQGRLNFELDGEPVEVGIGAAPRVVLADYAIEDAAWAAAGQPVKLRLRFFNTGGSRSGTTVLKWESPNDGVTFGAADARLASLNVGESATVPLTFTAPPGRAVAKLVAFDGGSRQSIVVPLYPAAEPVQDYQIADGRTLKVWQHGVKTQELELGEGNADGHAAPGERFSILLADGEALRAAEIFTNDACIDNSMRASDAWGDYDHVGATAKYSLPLVRSDCPPGHVVRMLARVLLPNAPEHRVRWAVIEMPVWYRRGEEPK